MVLYQNGLSRTRAEDLAVKLRYVYGPHWGWDNPETRVECERR